MKYFLIGIAIVLLAFAGIITLSFFETGGELPERIW